ncbi:UNVERIFIED_ORG: hypothetical protein J2W74_001303 [Methylorubrum zatmanii]
MSEHLGRGTPRRMGRVRLWHENINLTLAKGAKARMDSVLDAGEDRLDLIRTAIDKEVKRRERRRERQQPAPLKPESDA